MSSIESCAESILFRDVGKSCIKVNSVMFLLKYFSNMVSIRVYVGALLAGTVALCLYYQYIFLLFLLVNFASIYDAYYLYYKLGVNARNVCIFLLTISFVHIYLFELYKVKPWIVIKIICITQTSDIYQYIIGSRFGKNKIGWISQNKSYEGYYFGFIATVLTFVPVLMAFEETFQEVVRQTVIIYWLGVYGGLISSLFKRLHRIKDYSDMLGPHGGWVDRIDSIILPALLVVFIF